MRFADIDIISTNTHHSSVRTTVNIDEDVLGVVSRYAESRALSMGAAITELLRRGLESQRATRKRNGVHVFLLSQDSPRMTSKKVRDLETDLD